MRKKVLFGLLLVALMALSLLAACGPAAPTAPAPLPTPTPAPGAETVDLQFNHIFPPTHISVTEQFRRYFLRVEAATDGKYKLNIEYFPTGTLLAGPEVYDGVATGIVESGQSSFGYTPGRFPVMLTLNQPGIAPPVSSDAAAQTIWEFYNKFKPAELSDTKVLYLYATGPGYIHSNKPIQSIDDMKGLKIRVTGGGVRGVEAVGGDPVAMGMSEVYQAAQKGIIDALVSPPETLEGWKHHEIFDYSTPVPYFYSEFFWIAMNWDKWNSLPKGLQDAFDEVAEDAVLEAGAIWQYMQTKGMAFAQAQPGGHTFLQLPDSEIEKLKEMLKPVRDDYIKLLNEKGFDGEDIVNEAGKIVEKYNQMEYQPFVP